ncbi:MAG: FAD-dependent oxidoreductase [Erysipelotrichaceae bacterium]|nr:FAD-dependent oxidoreductase [Erysipelotrichaceae bacterium]
MSTCKLMEPIQVGSYTFKNRIVMAPMETRLCTPIGDTTQQMCDYYAERAKGGTAAIIVENTFVDSKASRSSISSSGLNTDHLIAGKFYLAQAIKENGAVAILQLSHGGIQASGAAVPGMECVGPSAKPSGFVGRMPRALEVEEIQEIEDAFAAAAFRAKCAGFDGVEIHGAHGYLICSFLSPYTNLRTDEYGGTREKRMTFLKNILRKVREKVGYEFLVGLRISGHEYVDGGLTSEDTCAIGLAVEDEVDYIHVSVGNYETMANWMISPMYRPEGAIVDLASAIKKVVTKAKVITVNALNPELAEKALQNDDCDLVAFGRPLIADPYLANKVKEGRLEDVRPCMRGHEGCITSFFAGHPIRCEVNAQAGREKEFKPYKVAEPKHVVVVGGGMAGMEAARVADLHGHKVTLLEATGELGGHFIEATEAHFKSAARGVLNWAKTQLSKSNVDVRLNTPATKESVAALNPDALIIAVGSEYVVPKILGIEKTLTAKEVIMDPAKAEGKIAIIGGGLVGTETALMLGQAGKDVTIVEMRNGIALEDEPLSQIALNTELTAAGVKTMINTTVKEIKDGALVVEQDGEVKEVACDTAVAALGLAARKDVVESLQLEGVETHVIGDAVRGRKLANCTSEAWLAVKRINGDYK